MAQEGAQVFATDVNMNALPTIREANIEIFKLDVMDTTSVKDGVTRANSDALFNYAMDLNVHSMMRTIKAAVVGLTKSIALGE